jgi:hypothetical protein
VLWAPRERYYSVSADDVDLAALEAIGYGFASFYELVPIQTVRGLALACPYPVHARVALEIAERLGCSVLPVLAAGLEVHVALALASRRLWPHGLAFGVAGLAGEEAEALLDDPDMLIEASTAARAGEALGVSPIDFLEQRGRLDADAADRLRARALGLAIDPSEGRDPEHLLPPELVEEHGIRVLADNPHGVVLGARRPTPLLARQIAPLFIDRAVAWRALVAPQEAV